MSNQAAVVVAVLGFLLVAWGMMIGYVWGRADGRDAERQRRHIHPQQRSF